VIRACVLALLCLASVATPAFAQRRYIPSDRPTFGTLEVDVGGVWTGSTSVGTVPADLTNNPGSGSGSFVLFETQTRVGSAPAFDGALDLFLSRHLSVEGGVQISRPALTVRNAKDAESAPDVTARSSLTQYLITGSLVYHLGGGAAGRLQPFLSGGGGYLRQVLEGGGLIDTGNEVHVAGGVRYWFNRSQRLGLRADARVSLQSGGVAFDNKRHTIPEGGAALAWRF